MASSSKSRRSAVADAWSVLPDVLLVDILGRLHTLQDFFTVRAVCRNWRIVASPSPDSLSSQSPFLLLCQYPNRLYDIASRRLYSFRFTGAGDTCSAFAYSHGHLITPFNCFDPTKSNIILRNFFTGSQIRLPGHDDFFSRILLSARPDSLHCLVVLLKKFQNSQVIQYLNVGDRDWSFRSSPQLVKLYDMMFFKGELLALNKDMELLAVELTGGSLTVHKLGSPRLLWRRKFSDLRLGELDGAILVVAVTAGAWYNNGWCKVFEVFTWNWKKKEWKEIWDLGDKALFISEPNNVFSISATQLGLRNNCIYFINYKGQWLEFSLKDKSSKLVKMDYLDLFATTFVWVLPKDF